MFNSDLSFFVQSLATTSIEELVETTFFFIYNLGLQPSEVDRLTTYEYMRYLTRYKEVRKQENEEGIPTIKSLMSLLGLGRKR